MWIGKLLGFAIGSFFSFPFGSFLGLWLGHLADQHINHGGRLASWDRSHAQRAFFAATFSVMGHIAKADGHVSKREIEMAENIMLRMRFDRTKTSRSHDIIP